MTLVPSYRAMGWLGDVDGAFVGWACESLIFQLRADTGGAMKCKRCEGFGIEYFAVPVHGRTGSFEKEGRTCPDCGGSGEQENAHRQYVNAQARLAESAEGGMSLTLTAEDGERYVVIETIGRAIVLGLSDSKGHLRTCSAFAEDGLRQAMLWLKEGTGGVDHGECPHGLPANECDECTGEVT